MDKKGGRLTEDFTRKIARAEERRIRSKGRKNHGPWFGVGMFGLVGWSVAVPTLAGVALGAWIDATTDSRYSWTLMLLLLGLILGCVNAWYWIKKESRDE